MLLVCVLNGGFRLIKFASNQIEVLDSIPEEDRRTGMKDVYFNSGTSFPREKGSWSQLEHWKW